MEGVKSKVFYLALLLILPIYGCGQMQTSLIVVNKNIDLKINGQQKYKRDIKNQSIHIDKNSQIIIQIKDSCEKAFQVIADHTGNFSARGITRLKTIENNYSFSFNQFDCTNKDTSDFFEQSRFILKFEADNCMTKTQYVKIELGEPVSLCK